MQQRSRLESLIVFSHWFVVFSRLMFIHEITIDALLSYIDLYLYNDCLQIKTKVSNNLCSILLK